MAEQYSSSAGDGKARVSIELSMDLLACIEAVREQYGMNSRSAVIEMILEEVLLHHEAEPG